MLEALAGVSPTWLSHQIGTHPHRAPTGISAPVLFFFSSFFFPFFFLVILPTSSINQGEAVFSLLGSSCNIRAEFREMAGKLAIPPHTCLLAKGRWAQCQRCLFILALGALICMSLMRVIALPHNMAPTTEQGLASSYRPLGRLLQRVRCWVTSLEVFLPDFWWGPSAVPLLWKRFGKDPERGRPSHGHSDRQMHPCPMGSCCEQV